MKYIYYLFREAKINLERQHQNAKVSPFKHSPWEPFHNNEDRSVANMLAEHVRIVCIVVTHPKNHNLKAIHIKATWGQHCNILLFASTQKSKSYGRVKVELQFISPGFSFSHKYVIKSDFGQKLFDNKTNNGFLNFCLFVLSLRLQRATPPQSPQWLNQLGCGLVSDILKNAWFNFYVLIYI